MRLIAFITDRAEVRKILEHIGVDAHVPRIAPARGPPLWDECDAPVVGECVDAVPDWDLAAQPAPDCQVDQRISWRQVKLAFLQRFGVGPRVLRVQSTFSDQRCCHPQVRRLKDRVSAMF